MKDEYVPSEVALIAFILTEDGSSLYNKFADVSPRELVEKFWPVFNLAYQLRNVSTVTPQSRETVNTLWKEYLRRRNLDLPKCSDTSAENPSPNNHKTLPSDPTEGRLKVLFPPSPPAIRTYTSKSPCRIFCDGVFDFTHAGHYNALRQAALLGSELWVGVCSDAEVLKAKGVLPIYTAEERAAMVLGCKWVSGVILNTPYDIDLKYFKQTGCDFVAHGDDVALNSEGVDCYAEIRKSGLLKLFRRTENVSTTRLVSRLMGVVDTVIAKQLPNGPLPAAEFVENAHNIIIPLESSSIVLSSSRLRQFLGEPKTVKPGDVVGYACGAFDIFHQGIVELFRRMKEICTYVVIGIYDDLQVRQLKGPAYPVQHLLDRTLNLLAMRDVDEVILGAPLTPTDEILRRYGVSVLFRSPADPVYDDENNEGLRVVTVDTDHVCSTEVIIERIRGNRERLRASLETRSKKEEAYKPSC